MSASATWPEVLGSLIGGVDLTSDQTAWAMGEVLSGQATDAQIAGFAVALRSKGETVEEMQGLVDGRGPSRGPAARPPRTGGRERVDERPDHGPGRRAQPVASPA